MCDMWKGKNAFPASIVSVLSGCGLFAQIRNSILTGAKFAAGCSLPAAGPDIERTTYTVHGTEGQTDRQAPADTQTITIIRSQDDDCIFQ